MPTTALATNQQGGSAAPTSLHLAESSMQGGSSEFGVTGSNFAEAVTSVTSRAYPRTMDPAIYKSTKSGVDIGLSEFFARPYPLLQGTLASTDVPTTFLKHDYFKELLETAHYAEKLKGKFLVRATIVVKLQVNANKFQAGRYILAFVPSGGIQSGDERTAWYNMHRHSIVQITQLPHVEIDLGTTTEATLEIPYVNQFLGKTQRSVGNTNYQGDQGMFFLYPYSPLVAIAGSTTAHYTIWVSLKDLALEGIALPQMALGDPIRDEQESANVGPVTSALQKVAKSVGVLNEIPLLSTFTQPVSWVAEVLSRAANIWGWSKPSNLEHVVRMSQYPLAYNTTVDTVDNAMPLSLFSTNAVQPVSGFGGTDVDEMAIDYLKTIRSYHSMFQWTESNNAGDALVHIPIGPMMFKTTTMDGLKAMDNYTPVCWLAQSFRLWRGGFTFTFKFVKTQFHSGRLEFVFNPLDGRSGVGNLPTVATAAYCHRAIVDIRDKTEVTLTIPYVNSAPWEFTEYDGNAVGIGTLSVFVVDPLVAPGTVSPAVDVLIEVAGGEDLEFSVPLGFERGSPVVPYTLQMDLAGISGDPLTVASEHIGGSSLVSDSIVDASHCIGEAVKSLRTLVKRYTFIGTATSPFLNVPQNELMIRAHAVEVGFNELAAYHPPESNDTLSWFSPAFLLSRGGVRFRILNDKQGLQLTSCLDWITWTPPDSLITQETTTHENRLGHKRGAIQEHNMTISGGIEVQVPQYHYSHSRAVPGELVCPTQLNVDHDFREHSPLILRVESATDDQLLWQIYRSAADDFSLGCFVSIPPVCTEDLLPEE